MSKYDTELERVINRIDELEAELLDSYRQSDRILRDENQALRKEIKNLGDALVYVAHASHGTPQYMLPKGVSLIDNDRVEVRLNAGVVVKAQSPFVPKD